MTRPAAHPEQPQAAHANQPLHDKVLAALNDAIAQSGSSLREIAKRAGTSHATLIAYRKGRKTPSATNLLKLIEACGYSADISLRPRIREANGLPRGDELVAVLRLAEQFPQRHQATLVCPPFQRTLHS